MQTTYYLTQTGVNTHSKHEDRGDNETGVLKLGNRKKKKIKLKMDRSNKTRTREPVKMKSNNKPKPKKIRLWILSPKYNNNIRPHLPLALMYDGTGLYKK